MLLLLTFRQVHIRLPLPMPADVLPLRLPLHSPELLRLLFQVLPLSPVMVATTARLPLLLPGELLRILIHGTLHPCRLLQRLLTWLLAAIQLLLPMLMVVAAHSLLWLLLLNLLLYEILFLK